MSMAVIVMKFSHLIYAWKIYLFHCETTAASRHKTDADVFTVLNEIIREH